MKTPVQFTAFSTVLIRLRVPTEAGDDNCLFMKLLTDLESAGFTFTDTILRVDANNESYTTKEQFIAYMVDRRPAGR